VTIFPSTWGNPRSLQHRSTTLGRVVSPYPTSSLHSFSLAISTLDRVLRPLVIVGAADTPKVNSVWAVCGDPRHGTTSTVRRYVLAVRMYLT